MAGSKYRQILAELKVQILESNFTSANPFPSESAYAREHGMTRNTVHRAFMELRRQGLIAGEPGEAPHVVLSKASRRIGVVVPDVLQTEYFLRIVRELLRRAEAARYTILFKEINGATAAARAACAETLVEDLIQQGVAGVIFQPVEYCEDGEAFSRRMLERLDDAHIPVVLCDNGIAVNDNRHDIVGTDNIRAGMDLYRHLVDRGARRICFFMRPHAPQTHEGRMRGMILAKLSGWQGSVCGDERLVCEPDDIAAIRRRVKSGRVDAFLCGDDETAAKLMQTLDRIGCAVPGKVLVAGFNDLRIASLLSPSLTTMRISCEQIAEAAFMRLLARINSPKLPPTEILLPAELVSRASTDSIKKSKPTKGTKIGFRRSTRST